MHSSSVSDAAVSLTAVYIRVRLLWRANNINHGRECYRGKIKCVWLVLKTLQSGQKSVSRAMKHYSTKTMMCLDFIVLLFFFVEYFWCFCVIADSGVIDRKCWEREKAREMILNCDPLLEAVQTHCDDGLCTSTTPVLRIILNLWVNFTPKSRLHIVPLTFSAIYPFRFVFSFWFELLSFGDISCGDVCPLLNIMELDATRLVVPEKLNISVSFSSTDLLWAVLCKLWMRPLFFVYSSSLFLGDGTY